MPVLSEPATHSPPASVESDEEWTGPPTNPFCPPVTRTFADFIESTGIAWGAPDEPPVRMNMLSAIEAPESVMNYEPAAYATSDDGDEDASVEPPQPRYGCGRGIPGFGRSFLTSSLVCALFVIYATAAPHTVSGVGGADARACAAPPVGGAAWTASAVPTTATSPPAPFHGNLGDAVGGAMPDAIPPRRQARYCIESCDRDSASTAFSRCRRSSWILIHRFPLHRLTVLTATVLVRGRGTEL
ncbi:hypothetical protein CYMTET_51469 [Cymbomonas tetramitiformis]|uniref:Uncharacterized protein n=1 Tax=Cymbomonas tetramitiformis TaxID=36881 RepID=A0AAE0BKZ9_9CHLO|nr:hypothetical protein CYMTET_51469 [Cymbomonas tetramitiformis]